MAWIPDWMQPNASALAKLNGRGLTKANIHSALRAEPEAMKKVCKSLNAKLAKARENQVRSKGGMSQTEIARAAIELLDWRRAQNLPPEKELIDLIASLTNANATDQATPKARWGRYVATYLFAENTGMSISHAARLTGMNKGTLSRVVKSSPFKSDIAQLKKAPEKVTEFLDSLFDRERKAFVENH